MNIQTEKLALIEWLTGVIDEEVVKSIKDIKDRVSQDSWDASVTDAEKRIAKQGYDDVINGRVYTQKEANDYFDSKYGKLD